VRRRHASHITVVLSKAAHSGPSVCLRARAPCPLRVSCPGTDRAERAAQAAGVSVQCKLQVLALPCLRWSRHFFYGFGVAQEGNGVYLVPVFGRAQVRFQTFDEGTGNEMLPRLEVVYILTGADVYQSS
jgi:hypothetical protein